jgi:hypothetical protein
MNSFAAKEKRSAPAVRKARPYVHHPMGPVQQAQQAAMRKILRPDEVQAKPDNEEEEPVQTKRIQRQMADMRGIRPSIFGYVGPEAKVQQAEIHRILRSTGTQAKLTVGQPNDKYEQEANRVADQVMAMPDPRLQRQPEGEEEEETLQTKQLTDQITPLVQRQEESPEEEEEEILQAKEVPGQTPEVTPGLESSINSLKGGGQPLDPATRTFFEPRFGHDFGHVQVHTDSAAANTAKAINARAFTLGNHVVMGSGEYQPTSQSGQRILGHELTHVIQQGEGRTSRKAQHRESIESDPIDAISRNPINNIATTKIKLGAIQERTQEVLNYIKKESKKRASTPPSINPNSKFYKVLKEFYLKNYLAKPTESEGKKAISKIGRTMQVRKRKGQIEVKPEGGEWRRAKGGKKGWEASALEFWNGYLYSKT